MKKDDPIERIRSCMFMESACAAVIHLLALNFPREAELWSQIAMDEEAHAEIIAKGLNINDPEDFIDFEVPSDLRYVRETVEYATEFKKMLVKESVSLRDAFEKVTSLLNKKNESYQKDLLGREADDRLKRVFQRLYEIDSSCINLVSAAMGKYDFTKEAGA